MFDLINVNNVKSFLLAARKDFKEFISSWKYGIQSRESKCHLRWRIYTSFGRCRAHFGNSPTARFRNQKTNNLLYNFNWMFTFNSSFNYAYTSVETYYGMDLFFLFFFFSSQTIQILFLFKVLGVWFKWLKICNLIVISKLIKFWKSFVEIDS